MFCTCTECYVAILELPFLASFSLLAPCTHILLPCLATIHENKSHLVEKQRRYSKQATRGDSWLHAGGGFARCKRQCLVPSATPSSTLFLTLSATELACIIRVAPEAKNLESLLHMAESLLHRPCVCSAGKSTHRAVCPAHCCGPRCTKKPCPRHCLRRW